MSESQMSMLEIGGVIKGLQLSSDFSAMLSLRMVREVKEQKLYTIIGHTWESWCKDVLKKTPKTVQARLDEGEELGYKLLDSLLEMGTKARTISGIAALPEECRPGIENNIITIPAINPGEETITLPLESENAGLVNKHLNDRVKIYRETQRTYKAELKDREVVEKSLRKQLTDLAEENDNLKGQLGQRNSSVQEEADAFESVASIVAEAVAALRTTNLKAIAEHEDPELSASVSSTLQSLKTSVTGLEKAWFEILSEVED